MACSPCFPWQSSLCNRPSQTPLLTQLSALLCSNRSGAGGRVERSFGKTLSTLTPSWKTQTNSHIGHSSQPLASLLGNPSTILCPILLSFSTSIMSWAEEVGYRGSPRGEVMGRRGKWHLSVTVTAVGPGLPRGLWGERKTPKKTQFGGSLSDVKNCHTPFTLL